MLIGVVLPASESDGQGHMPTWPEISEFALAAESHGLDSVWMFDHFFHRPENGPTEGQHEAWTIVSAVAAVTERVQVGTLVMCTSFRSAGMLAKMAAAADEVSRGRLVLGLGAGWHDPEYDAFGYPKSNRVDRFDELLQIVIPLLRGETVSYSGTYHEVSEAVLAPTPNRRIPILLAAFGPRMLRLTARDADMWNTAWFGEPDDELHGELAHLEEACAAEGRDPSTLGRTVGVEIREPSFKTADDGKAFTGSVEELARMLDSYESLGIDHLIAVLQPMTVPSIERLARAIEMRGGAFR